MSTSCRRIQVQVSLFLLSQYLLQWRYHRYSNQPNYYALSWILANIDYLVIVYSIIKTVWFNQTSSKNAVTRKVGRD